MLAISQTEQRICRIISPHAEALGFEIVRVRMHDGNNARLQIMADKPHGNMNVDDCAQLSRAIGAALDVEEPVPGPYALEISSPGINRPLTRQGDFARWIGHLARIETKIPIENRKKFTGTILGENNKIIKLALQDNNNISIALEQMNAAELVLTEKLIAMSPENGANRRHEE